MAVGTEVFIDPNSNERHTKITDLLNVAQMITQENGILRHIHIQNGAAGQIFAKTWNKAGLVAPDTDDADNQYRLLGSGTNRQIDFDTDMGTFTGGMQIAATLVAGLDDTAPAAGIDVDVYWTETS